MTQVLVEELGRIMHMVGREPARFVSDGKRITLFGQDGSVRAVSRPVGPFLGEWDLTMYYESVQTLRAWLRMAAPAVNPDTVIDMGPFWGGDPVLVVFSGLGTQMAFRVLECPTAPRRSSVES